MTEKRIELTNEFLTQQMNHWMLFPLPLTLLGLLSRYRSYAAPDLLMWAASGLFPAAFFLLRVRMLRFLPFVLTHMAAALLCVILPAADSVSRGVCVLCGICYLIHSFALRVKGDRIFNSPLHPWTPVALSVISLFLLHHQGIRDWDLYYVLTVIFCLALYFVIFYLQHYLDFLSVNKSSTGCLPTGEMFSSGLKMVLGYTLLCTLILLFITNVTWLESLADMLKGIALALLRFLVSLLPVSGPEEEVPITAEGMPPANMGEMLPADTEDPFWLWVLLEKIAGILFICAICYAAVRLFIALVRFLKERFALHSIKKSGQEDSASADIREKCGTAARSVPREKRSLFEMLSPSAQIRRLYRKKILSSANTLTHVSGSAGPDRLTAREWEEKLGTSGMADIYEQTRYSSREMTGKDVRKMKEACKISTNL